MLRPFAFLVVLAGLVLSLPLAGQENRVFSGQVKWENGVPASDVGLSVFGDGKELANAATDPGGYFMVRIPSSSRPSVLVATAFHFEGGVMLIDAVGTKEITDSQPANITLVRSGHGFVEGYVRLDKMAVEGAQVELRNKKYEFLVIRRTLSRANGRYELSGLPVGDYLLVSLKDGKKWTGIVSLTSAVPQVEREIELK